MLACQRSPDSQKIAYASVPQDASGDTALFVADFAALPAAHAVLPDGITAGDFAFSPDSRRIAFFGCDRSTNFCGLFLLDLASGKLTRSAALSYVDHILWNPDGSGLALVGSGDSGATIQKNYSKNLLYNEIVALSQNWHFMVVNATSGEVVFKRVFDWNHPSAPPGSPTYQWPVPFAARSSGLDGCSVPKGS
jgi:WD40 repeat protein